MIKTKNSWLKALKISLLRIVLTKAKTQKKLKEAHSRTTKKSSDTICIVPQLFDCSGIRGSLHLQRGAMMVVERRDYTAKAARLQCKVNEITLQKQ